MVDLRKNLLSAVSLTVKRAAQRWRGGRAVFGENPLGRKLTNEARWGVRSSQVEGSFSCGERRRRCKTGQGKGAKYERSGKPGL